MDYEELDSWYEDQKQLLLEQYTKELEQKKDRDKIEKEFRGQMKKIHEQYEKLFEKYKKQKEKKGRFKKLTSIIKRK